MATSAQADRELSSKTHGFNADHSTWPVWLSAKTGAITPLACCTIHLPSQALCRGQNLACQELCVAARGYQRAHAAHALSRILRCFSPLAPAQAPHQRPGRGCCLDVRGCRSLLCNQQFEGLCDS